MDAFLPTLSLEDSEADKQFRPLLIVSPPPSIVDSPRLKNKPSPPATRWGGETRRNNLIPPIDPDGSRGGGRHNHLLTLPIRRRGEKGAGGMILRTETIEEKAPINRMDGSFCQKTGNFCDDPARRVHYVKKVILFR
jgi:hypothetical protein